MTAKILITRPLEDAERLQALCFDFGFEPILAPLMSIVPVKQPAPLPAFKSIAFTSANGVRCFDETLTRPLVPGLPVFAVGQITAEICAERGYKVKAIAEGDVVSLAETIKGVITQGPVLHPCGRHLAGDLVRRLSTYGLEAIPWQVYEAKAETRLPKMAADHLRNGLDWVTLLSPRTARLFEDLTAQAGLMGRLKQVRAVVLSKNVAASMTPSKWRKIYTAPSPDVTELIDIIRAETHIKGNA